MAEKFDISIERVEKLPVPLLVVGLGGTGVDTLITIKKKFAERYVLEKINGQDQPKPAKTAYLGIDSESNIKDGLEINEYVDISLPGLENLLANQGDMLTPDEKEWVNRDMRHSTRGMGMGTVRQAGRLALERNYIKVETAIKSAINSIAGVEQGTDKFKGNDKLEIIVVTGIGGGTGSGTFLDMAQILRNVARATVSFTVTLTGYIVMPDVSLANASTTPGMAEPIKHNAYAALKELDFWMRYKKDHETKYTMTYGGKEKIEWERPFDQCVLISSTNVEGSPYLEPYKAVRETIAENLMHYMAKESVAEGESEYSYRSYEDNLDKIPIATIKYPVNYGYRAIGAFTKRIPKKAVLYYEGKILFDDFVPKKDENGKLQPDNRMFKDGKDMQRTEGITGKPGQMCTDFKTNSCKMPSYCNIDISDKGKVKRMAENQRNIPHQIWHRFRDETVNPAAIESSERYLAKAWERFSDFASEVISDPEQGPFALEKYLDAEGTLIASMEDTLSKWKAKADDARRNITGFEGECKTTWGDFCHPPILGRRAALQGYVDAMQNLYSSVVSTAFYENYAEALRKLILRVREYLRDGLKPMTKAILSQYDEFQSVETMDKTMNSDIYTVDEVKESIDKQYSEENENGRLLCRFLGECADVTLSTVPSVETRSSGVAFTCRQNGYENMCIRLQEELKETFGSVNEQSLDAVMISRTGSDVADQNAWIDNLTRTTRDSALPMFKRKTELSSGEYTSYSYMSVPEDAPAVCRRIKEAASANEHILPKKSALKDHLYCLLTYDKLPLYGYADIDDLARQYSNDINDPKAAGMHLVRTGAPNADFNSDWTKLPSPKPYFLFSRTGTVAEMQAYDEVRQLTKRGIDCGMIEVDATGEYARGTVHILYQGDGVLTSQSLMTKRSEIASAINPATAAPYSKGENISKLKELLASAKDIKLYYDKLRPAGIAGVLGLEHEHCDPFDPNILGDETATKEAWENHRKLSVAVVESLIYTRPDVVRALEMQIDAVEKITQEIAAAGESGKIWTIRQDYAETGAEIFIYLNDVLSFSSAGYKYTTKAGKNDIINPALVKDDVKDMESFILQCICYLADVPGDNPAKAELEKMLAKAKRDFDRAVDEGTLTGDEVKELIQAADDIYGEMDEEETRLQRELHKDPSKADEIRQITDVAEKIMKVCTSNTRTLRKIAKGLD